MSEAQTAQAPALHLTRWTVTSGSNVQSRGAVVIEAGKHHWRASAEGNGAVDALYNAVDVALADVLHGEPRLTGYDVHALGEGREAEGLVIVAIEPPPGLEGDRSAGLYQGRARSTNIVASSIEAYIEALNAMLAEAHWAGAAEAASKGRKGAATETHGRRGELDPDANTDLPWVG
ncbi:MAG TPA: alpha-isopropylmalate synthase regulatory domain-containing protein [Candidatus Limnocylindrales bacterium]|jgi:2-isopropylmalate synthase|nr:alpha-isopropylmalate synthase regulatory domain-containing protein [Candidatus Limnocylindrales bacterium]